MGLRGSNDSDGDKSACRAAQQETEANEDQDRDPKFTAAHQHLLKMRHACGFFFLA
jgi:hypothetical protein